MYVVIRAARTAPDRRMSCAIVARAPRTFRDAAWTLRLVYRRRYSHIEGLGSVAALGLRGRCCLPAQRHYRRSPSRLGSRRRRPGNRRLYSGSRNRHHRTSRSGSRDHRSHWPGVHRRARYRATVVVARAVANEWGWGVKNWTLALRIFFYIRLDLVRLDQIALSGLSFL
jgi:hypothetical protein